MEEVKSNIKTMPLANQTGFSNITVYLQTAISVRRRVVKTRRRVVITKRSVYKS